MKYVIQSFFGPHHLNEGQNAIFSIFK
jgi:hypothetical protein